MHQSTVVIHHTAADWFEIELTNFVHLVTNLHPIFHTFVFRFLLLDGSEIKLTNIVGGAVGGDLL